MAYPARQRGSTVREAVRERLRGRATLRGRGRTRTARIARGHPRPGSGRKPFHRLVPRLKVLLQCRVAQLALPRRRLTTFSSRRPSHSLPDPKPSTTRSLRPLGTVRQPSPARSRCASALRMRGAAPHRASGSCALPSCTDGGCTEAWSASGATTLQHPRALYRRAFELQESWQPRRLSRRCALRVQGPSRLGSPGAPGLSRTAWIGEYPGAAGGRGACPGATPGLKPENRAAEGQAPLQRGTVQFRQPAGRLWPLMQIFDRDGRSATSTSRIATPITPPHAPLQSSASRR
jgi:hypothetical protein